MRIDAFRPDLATALGMFGQVLEANGREAEALTSFRGGIATRGPSFLALPEAHRGLMRALIAHHARLADSLGQELDYELLGAIVDAASALESAPGTDEEHAGHTD